MIWCLYLKHLSVQKKPALYALEVNQGWFNRNDINVGDILAIDKILKND